MKKIFAVLCVASVTISNAQNVILAGKITNPNSDSLVVSNSSESFSHTIHLKNDGTFRDTFLVKEGDYWLNDGTERTMVYLKPDYNLYLTIDTKEFDETIEYKGKGANENNYLAKKMLLEEADFAAENPGIFAQLSEEEFLKLQDSARTIKRDFFKKYEADLNKDFAYKEQKLIEISYLNKLANYEWMHQYFTKDTSFRVSKTYPNPFVKVDMSDEKLADEAEYISFLQRFLRIKAEEKHKTDTTQLYYAVLINIIKNEVANSKVRNGLAKFEYQTKLNADKNIDTIYALIKSLITDQELLAKVNDKYAILSKVSKGKMSPNFELQDINDKTVSLESLKGKAVYIDIWATWCGPCKREIPELKKLQEEFSGQNIEFVSICTWDKKENWEKMVKEKELKGIQLFAPDGKIDFFKAYDLQGVPHFILLDKEGKIVSGNADRPSDANIREQLKVLL